MIDFTLTFRGTRPLLMHNSRLANPLDPATKAIKAVTSKRKKTDEDHETIARLEHSGSLYLDKDFGPYIPGENLSRCLVDGAKITRQGVSVTRGLIIKSDVNPLSYRGPRTADELWEAGHKHMASVKVGTQRVMRCRPIFENWSLEADGLLDPAVLELSDVVTIATNAGLMCGLGDWRPRFGRFEAEVVAK
jgi:hypothetical protein